MSVNPRQELTTITDNVLKSTNGLLEATNRDFYENIIEKGVYAYVFAKPSHRLSSLLNIDREILILITNFSSQQARTVKAIKAIINTSDGRLEPLVVIVVHPDPKGNTKLKTWGRENGISILPIYYSRELFPMKREDLENTLCKELFSYDPFDVTGPVSDDSQFYGRRTEALDMARHLQTGQIKATLGIRKIGKTSILNRIVDICKNHYECLIVFIDCSKDDIWALNSSELLYSISVSLQKARSNNDRYTMLIPTSIKSDGIDFKDELIKEVLLCELPIILVFDEIDYISPGSPTTNKWIKEFNIFWRNLRVIYQECLREKRPFSLLISGVSSKWFHVESIDGIENAALALVPEDYLSPLPRGATIAMIKALSKFAGLQFDDITAEMIAFTCCDSPYWVRKACSFIHKRIDIKVRPFKLEQGLVKQFLDDFVNTEGAIIAQVALRHLFRVYPELKQWCSLCNNNKIDDVPKSFIGILSKYGIIAKNKGKLELSGSMIKEGLSLIFDEQTDTDSSSIAKDSIEKGSIFEWADELALINRRRNILEKKLRGIVINFIRFDSLQNKAKPTLYERLLVKIDEKKRKQIERLSPDEIMEKLLWTELVKIIIGEWSLFERVFSDKAEFSANSKIINDRFDAHAKNADEADIALYRRSLKWFEDKLV